MKKCIVMLFCSFCLTIAYGQTNRHSDDKNLRISTDIMGTLQYEKRGVKATLSKNIFDDKIYKDTNGNEATYSKEIWIRISTYFDGDEYGAFEWLIRHYKKQNNVVEKLKINIFDQIEYTNKNKFAATFGKNIFDGMVYSDTNNNKIVYSKEFATEILDDYQNDDIRLFVWMIDRFQATKNNKEEYEVDFFGQLRYTNSQSIKAALSKNNSDRMIYEDSNGNKLEFANQTWHDMLEQYGSDKKAFVSLITDYLYKTKKHK